MNQESFFRSSVRKLLKLPEDYRIEILISLGYPEGEVRPRRLRPMEELLHFNAWQEEV